MKKVLDTVFEMYCIITCLGAFIGLFACYMFVPMHGMEGFFISMMATNFVFEFLLDKFVKEDDEE